MLIGYARVSTRPESTDRQESDLFAAGVRHDDLYVDQGVSGVRGSRTHSVEPSMHLSWGTHSSSRLWTRLADPRRTGSISRKGYATEALDFVC